MRTPNVDRGGGGPSYQRKAPRRSGAGVLFKGGRSLRSRVRWRGRNRRGLTNIGRLACVVGLARGGGREERDGVLGVLLDLGHGRDLDVGRAGRLRRLTALATEREGRDLVEGLRELGAERRLGLIDCVV